MDRPLRGAAKPTERKLKSSAPTLEGITDFNSLRRYLKVPVDSWDAFLIGDGSGTTWKLPCGWGSILIERGKHERTIFHGGMSHGTNNVAEIMSILHGLMFCVQRKDGVRPGGYRVHVVSDSEYVVNGLREDDPVWASNCKENRPLWLAVHGTRRQGLVITSHHVPRNQVDLQTICDGLAGQARKSQLPLAGPWKEKVLEANPL